MKDILIDILVGQIVTRLFVSKETVIPIIGNQSDCTTVPTPTITGGTIVGFNHPVMYTPFLFVI